jgi:lipid-A-disaccharide synthase
MLIGIVAGEPSGDFLGAQLMASLRKRLPDVEFVGIGGPKMEGQRMKSWYPMERLAVRGYVEVLRHYAGLVSMRSQLKSRLLAASPSLFIGVDAPDFNLSLEAGLKRRGIPTIHYVSPSLWAWRGGRIRNMARSVDHVLALFPFEEQMYRKAGIAATYVGHPLADAIQPGDWTRWGREQLRMSAGAKIFAMLPGSRLSELKYHADLFVKTALRIAKRIPDARFLVPLVSRETRNTFEAAQYDAQAADLRFTLLFGHAREAIAASDAVLVASGTATLETALYRKPMVITYRMSPASWGMISRMRYQPWVGLPNIIAGRFLVPEILQEQATPENLAQALLNVCLDPDIQRRLPAKFADMHALLRRDASERAAEVAIQCLRAA